MIDKSSWQKLPMPPPLPGQRVVWSQVESRVYVGELLQKFPTGRATVLMLSLNGITLAKPFKKVVEFKTLVREARDC